jgi:hypothetical protein
MKLSKMLALGMLGGGVAHYSISGTVTDGATGIDGVTVAIGVHSTTTAGGGLYTLAGLPAGTSGNLTATKTGYVPLTITISAMSGNLTGQNFIFTPLLVWYDFSNPALLFTDAGTTPVSADGDLIYKANDKSGNNRHLTQSVSGQRPSYKINILNSKPIGRFWGSFNNTFTIMNTVSIAHSIGTGNFYFIVVYIRKEANSDLKGLAANGTYAPAFYTTLAATGEAGIYWTNAAKQFATKTVNGNAYIVEYLRDNGVLKCYVNGVLDANTFAVSTSMADAVFSLGGSLPTGGYGEFDCGELMFCKGLPASLTDFRNYLNSKWAIF